MSNGKTISDKDKKLIGGIGGKTVSDFDKSIISKAYALARRIISPNKAMSDKDFMNAFKKIRDAKKKGKPHLKKGGKAKKMKAYSKGGKAK